VANELDIYAGLDTRVQAVAREVVEHIGGLQQRLMTDIIEIGRTLSLVKEAVGHGHFLPWLRKEFNWTERTAQNFMSAAERFGANPKCVSHLPLATVYRLAAPSTPDDLREKIVARLEGGEELKPDEIYFQIKEARRAAQRLDEEAKKSPRSRAQEKVWINRRIANEASANAQYFEEQRLRNLRRESAADLIVSGLSNADLNHLLSLIEDGWAIGRRDILSARTRASQL